MAQQKSKEQQQQKLQAIAKEYQTNAKFKQQIDTAYEAAKQQSPEQIAQLETQYKENSKIIFAYMMLEQQQTQYARSGAKLAYIQNLNNYDPEIGMYMSGGCVKKRRNFKCGGVTKKEDGGVTRVDTKTVGKGAAKTRFTRKITDHYDANGNVTASDTVYSKQNIGFIGDPEHVGPSSNSKGMSRAVYEKNRNLYESLKTKKK